MSEKENKKARSRSADYVQPHKVRNYFVIPVVYALILLIIAVPIELAIKDKINENILNSYRNTKNYSYYDEISIERKLPLSGNETQKVVYAPIEKNEGYGKLIIESVGVNCEVYRGIEGKSNLRVGVGSDNALPGSDDTVYVSGYSTKHFKNLCNVKVNDIVTFNTTYGKYTYKVCDVLVTENLDNKLNGRKPSLVMYCANGNAPFDCDRAEKIYVIADLVSGPAAVEDVK